MLKRAVMPKREVDDFEIQHIDRRFFQGLTAIQMVERILNIENTMSTQYKFGYKNNHATFDGGNNRN